MKLPGNVTERNEQQGLRYSHPVRRNAFFLEIWMANGWLRVFPNLLRPLASCRLTLFCGFRLQCDCAIPHLCKSSALLRGQLAGVFRAPSVAFVWFFPGSAQARRNSVRVQDVPAVLTAGFVTLDMNTVELAISDGFAPEANPVGGHGLLEGETDVYRRTRETAFE